MEVNVTPAKPPRQAAGASGETKQKGRPRRKREPALCGGKALGWANRPIQCEHDNAENRTFPGLPQPFSRKGSVSV
jgi:hypothetical protein